MSFSGTLLSRFENLREATSILSEPLSDEDCCVQSMTDASPVKWHLAHTTWFFETFVLERFETAFQPYHPAFRMLYNSYYNSIGEQYPRSQRGLITRPSMDEVHEYRSDVDARIASLILIAAAPSGEPNPELEGLIELGLQHEQQHQELILTDLQHLLWCNPLRPAYRNGAMPVAAATPLRWRMFEGGTIQVGNAADSFCFDNELPRHKRYLEPYALASRLVTNAEFLAFMEAGSYQNPSLWLSEGWAWLHAGQMPISHPLYWEQQNGAWHEFTLYGLQPLDPNRAVVHLSYYEADAYARWAGARLPSEAEWEHAASTLGQRPPSGEPADVPAIEQLYDTAWQWTSSSYSPYPGYKPATGAIGEYNGKFMVNQYVLRGGSCVTPPDHSRATYRNFFPCHARWQYTGIRLARSQPS